jgi:vacuolar protein sorting-associated protein 13A/C
VRADGQKQVLRISDYNAELSLYKPRGSRTKLGPVRQDSVASTSEEAFEAITEEFRPTLTFGVSFSSIGISLVNRQLVEILYTSVTEFSFDYANSNTAQSVNVALGQLQIDNQLHDAIYPVILQPTPFNREASGATPPPTVQSSVVWLKDEGA